jgi:hypothetical protein|tara:strand:+ start:8446 stop:8865 length:420 start_codon:yes stop_codon:yes gene_type:complete
MMEKVLGRDKPKWKVAPKRVPADDCIITVEGEEIAVHKGEWIEIIPVGTLRTYTALLRVQNLVLDDSDSQVLHDLCEEVAERVIAWNFTGLDGKNLAKPYQNARVIEGLTSEEVAWIVKILQGESPGERKKDSEPSEQS